MGIIYAISDIHGYYDIMEKTLEQVDLKDVDNKLVLCGDYIDYGPDSCKVLYRIKELMEIYPGQVIALKGNHETMFLEFLGADDQNLWNVEWLSTDKGFSTINTFISEKLKEQIRNFYSENDTIASFYKLAKLIKEDIKIHHRELVNWLKDLPLYYETEKKSSFMQG
ncbi:MAG: metallophosphoesterase [Caldicoprobacterales bacterium]